MRLRPLDLFAVLPPLALHSLVASKAGFTFKAANRSRDDSSSCLGSSMAKLLPFTSFEDLLRMNQSANPFTKLLPHPIVS
jgi:hypothetical protein